MTLSAEIKQVSDIPNQNKPILYDDNHRVIGTYDGYDIHVTPYMKEYTTFCIADDDKEVIAFPSIKKDEAEIHGKKYLQTARVWVDGNNRGKGLVTIFYAFLTQKLKEPLLIDNLLTPKGMRQIDNMIKSGSFDVSYYNASTSEITKERPDGVFTDTPNPWRVILENGPYSSTSPLFGHGERILSEHWHFRNDPNNIWD